MTLECLKNLCSCISQRYVVAIFGFTGIINAYAMRTCLTMTLTRMVGGDNDVKAHGEPIFDWSHKEQGLVRGSFYIGYLLTHVPGGMLADTYGGKTVLGLGMVSTAILTVLTPVVTVAGGLYAIVAWRILIGLGEGVTFPAISSLVSQWVPERERAKIGALIFGGGQIGTVMGFYMTAIFLDTWKTKWSPAYYVFGGIGLFWNILFYLFAYSSPSSHPYITEKEKDWLQKEMGQLKRNVNLPRTPWVQMFKSPALWALIFAQYGHDWGFYAMNSDLNKYFKDVQGFDTKSNGLYAAMPFAVMWVVSIASGWLCDILVNSGRLEVTRARIWFTSLGAICPAIFLMCASYVGRDEVLVITFFTLTIAFMGFFYPGVKVNAIDLGPNYAGATMGLVNGIGSTAGIIEPILCGQIAHDSTMEQWRIVFWLSFVVLVFTSVVFLMFGSGDKQDWNDPDPNDNTTRECCRKFFPCCKHGEDPPPPKRRWYWFW